MTISATQSRTSALATNAAAPLQGIDYTFGAASGELKVFKRVTLTGVETELTEGAADGYTATYSDTGGTVTLAEAVPVTYTIIIYRDTPMTQALDLEEGGDFNAGNIETAFDKSMKLIQENAEDLDLSIRAPKDDPLATDLVLPSSIERANTYLGFDADGNVELATSATTSATSTRTSMDIITKGPWHDVRAYGAEGDGTTDDAPAIRDAITAAGTDGYVYFPTTSTGYVVRSTLTVVNPMHIIGHGATIYYDFPTTEATDVNLFLVSSSDVTIDGLIFDGSKTTGEGLSQNRRCVLAQGAVATHIKNVHVRNCKFTGLDAVQGTTYVEHGVYFEYCDESTVQDCWFNDISGAVTFIKSSHDTKVLRNYVRDTGWYSIHYEEDCEGFEIGHNWIGGTTAGIRNFGGSINIMSAEGSASVIRRGTIHHNHITGLHHDSYPYAIRLLSCAHIDVEGNIIEGCTTTTETTNFFGVYMGVRGAAATSSNNGPCNDINIRGNTFVAGEAEQLAVGLEQNDFNKLTLGNAQNITIDNNQIYSPSATDYFFLGVLIRGDAYGGVKNLKITNNTMNGVPIGTGVGAAPAAGGLSPGGLIGLIGYSATYPIDLVTIANNRLTGLGAATQSYDIGIVISQYTDNIDIFDNTIKDFAYAIRLLDLHGFVRARGNHPIDMGTANYTVADVAKVSASQYDFVEFLTYEGDVLTYEGEMLTTNGSL